MELIDTHTHNTDEAYAGCEDQVVRRALDAGITHLLQADIDSSTRAAMFDICSRWNGVLHPMLGLYPGSVSENWREEIDRMLAWKNTPGIVAVGEIGLDYHYGAEFKKEQKEALKLQFELASEWDLPVNIHLRDATEDFFEVMEDCRHLRLRGNLHAFSGSFQTFRRMQKYGEWYVGIGGVVTFKNASIAKEVADIPMDRILLETDAPYLAPTPHRGERNESSLLPLIAAKIAEIKGLEVQEVARISTLNAKNLFNL